MHLSRQLNCSSLRRSWSIACRCCSNYIFILYLAPGFNRLGKDKCKTRRESFKFWDLVRLYGNHSSFFFRGFLDRVVELWQHTRYKWWYRTSGANSNDNFWKWYHVLLEQWITPLDRMQGQCHSIVLGRTGQWYQRSSGKPLQPKIWTGV